jgi:hypothetical protein
MSFQRARLVFFLSLALTLVLAACGSNGADDAESVPTEPPEADTAVTDDVEPTAEPSPSPTATVEPTPSPAPSPTATPEPTPSPEPSPSPMPTVADSPSMLTSEDLEAYLLTADDVPGDWTLIPSYGNPTDDPPCDHAGIPPALEDAPFAQVNFERDNPNSIVGQFVIWLESEDDAIDGAEWYQEIFQCEAPVDGAGTTWQGSSLPIPEFGDDSFAWELVAEMQDEQYILQFAFIRQGQFLSMIGQSDIDTADPEMLESLMSTMADRLPE